MVSINIVKIVSRWEVQDNIKHNNRSEQLSKLQGKKNKDHYINELINFLILKNMKLRNLMYATMIACAFASCSNDDVPTPDNGNPDVEGGTSLA